MQAETAPGPLSGSHICSWPDHTGGGKDLWAPAPADQVPSLVLLDSVIQVSEHPFLICQGGNDSTDFTE